MGMIVLEPLPQAIGGERACRVPREAERIRDRRAEERIPERIQNQGKRAFGDMMLFMANGQLSDQAADRIENRIQRVAVAGKDHPGGERAGTFTVEHVENPVDDVARFRFARAPSLHRLGDARSHRIGDRARKRALEARRRSEMMEEVGVSPADFGGDRLQGHRLRPGGEQQAASGLDRGGATLPWAQSFTPY